MRAVTVYGSDMKPRTFSEGVIDDPVIEAIDVSVEEVFAEA